MYYCNTIITMLESIIASLAILTGPACQRVACTDDGYKVKVVYTQEIPGAPEEVGGCFGRVDDARCYCERNVGVKGVWMPDNSSPEKLRLINIKASQIQLCIVEQTGPFVSVDLFNQ